MRFEGRERDVQQLSCLDNGKLVEAGMTRLERGNSGFRNEIWCGALQMPII
ncbi:hypothetical protein IFO69_00030 [Echinicola sp. CAU 1574]|uniref:Uncharacterized protein n=1 Tax=Echinicola arenosa TaxID=2774144 RepID=A0ABR9AEW4_9BACT|nr:hypothetical protein [Echinicola arenosa]